MKLKNIYVLVSAFFLVNPFMIRANKSELYGLGENVKVIFSPEYNIAKSLANLIKKDVRQGDELHILSTFFTDDDLSGALTLVAKRKNVDVSVIVDYGSLIHKNTDTKNKADEVLKRLSLAHIATHVFNAKNPFKNKKQIEQFGNPIQMHVKAAIWTHTNEDGTKDYRIATGSGNFSNTTKESQEHLVIYRNNIKLFEKYKSLLNHIVTRIDSPELIESDAEMVQYYTAVDLNSDVDLFPFPIFSYKDHLLRTIYGLLKATEENDEIDISTYTYNDERLTKELLAAKQRGAIINLIVDKEKNLNSEITCKQFDQLVKQKISVFCFDRNKEKRGFDTKQNNHSKYIIIKKNERQHVVIEGSANLTKQANVDINQITIHQNDNSVYAAFKNHHDRLRRCLYDSEKYIHSEIRKDPFWRFKKKYGNDIVVSTEQNQKKRRLKNQASGLQNKKRRLNTNSQNNKPVLEQFVVPK